MGVKTKVSEGGRIVIPKKIRKKFGIKKEEDIKIEVEGKKIILRPESLEENPVEKLYGSAKTEPEQSPKKEARKWVTEKLEKEAS